LCIFCNKKRSNLVTFTTALTETFILCLFSFILQILIFHFLTYFVFCKKTVKHPETGKYFVTGGAAVVRWREFCNNFLSTFCHIITANVSLFRRGFFTFDMLHLLQNIKTLIQRLSFRFVPLFFTPLSSWLKGGVFRDKRKWRINISLVFRQVWCVTNRILVIIHIVEQTLRV
jgi:hypothetical protein